MKGAKHSMADLLSFVAARGRKLRRSIVNTARNRLLRRSRDHELEAPHGAAFAEAASKLKGVKHNMGDLFVDVPHELDFAHAEGYALEPGGGGEEAERRQLPPMSGEFELSPMQRRAAAAVLDSWFRTTAPEIALVLPFGSGKTVIAAAALHEILMEHGGARSRYKLSISERACLPEVHPTDTITVAYSAEQALAVAAVFVRRPTVDAWVEHLRRAGLRVARAVTPMEFQTRFDIELAAAGGPPWDVVVVRDGYISSLECCGGGTVSTVKAVKLNCKKHRRAFAAAVYDDYDKGQFKLYEGVPARGALLVSGSTLKTAGFRVGFDPAMTPIPTPTLQWNHILSGACHAANHVVRAAAHEINNDMQVPSPRARLLVFTNPDDRFTAMLTDLAGGNVGEMLNGMAFRTAAHHLGISSRSPAEMFRFVLKSRYLSWVTHEKALKYLRAVLSHLEWAPRLAPNDETAPRNYCERRVAAITRSAAELAKMDIEQIPDAFTHTAGQLEVALTGRIAAIKAAGAENENAILRFRARVTEGECLVCSDDEFCSGFFVLTCCFTLLCVECFASGTNRRKNVGRCPSCRGELSLKDDATFVDAAIDFEALIRGCPDDETSRVAAAPPEAEEEIFRLPPKLMALVFIARGEPIPAEKCPHEHKDEELTLKLPNVLGNGDAPTAAGPPSVLVFASYNESLDLIEETLEAYAITHGRLGQGSQLDREALDNFATKRIRVLLVCSQRDSSGLNLQTATDIVFFNEISRQGELAQALGRVQRYGRNGVSARCHVLAFPNEIHLIAEYRSPPTSPFPFYPPPKTAAACPAEALSAPELDRKTVALQRRVVLAYIGAGPRNPLPPDFRFDLYASVARKSNGDDKVSQDLLALIRVHPAARTVHPTIIANFSAVMSSFEQALDVVERGRSSWRNANPAAPPPAEVLVEPVDLAANARFDEAAELHQQVVDENRRQLDAAIAADDRELAEHLQQVEAAWDAGDLELAEVLRNSRTIAQYV